MKIEKGSKNIFYRLFVTVSMMNYLNFRFIGNIFTYGSYGFLGYEIVILVCHMFDTPNFVYVLWRVFFVILAVAVFLSYFLDIYNFLFNRYEFEGIFFDTDTLNTFYEKLQEKSVKLIIFQSVLMYLTIFAGIVVIAIYGLFMLLFGIIALVVVFSVVSLIM